MSASLLAGKPIASAIMQDIKQTVMAHEQKGHRPPGLAVILVGADPASLIYVNNKRKACHEVGFKSYAYDLPEQTSEKDLLMLIEQLNEANDIDGILVQLPLPSHIHTQAIIERLKPTKDVDGFHPYNLGRLAQGNPQLRPCTPYGIIQMLNYYQLTLSGKHAVVVGASNIVGRPMALEFLLAKATVTICHRATRDLEHHVRAADILVVATGVPDVINVNWLNKQQIIIDVGIHRNEDGTLRGDVDYALAKDKVAWITPVPGGVGPMTISTLLKNTFYAASHLHEWC
ncbi:bifunctional methylenetetrahydrofolate dehydrogenase/methenyltetrahydrofolate cyclohydrolase FolD [Legionella oakridgensis]|uniref:Bifunctional protein FolD n=2 Tax=Legionella oakridgensis TaxID=29423 RepID=W0BFN1_9GAMM|nr:bifunctional methylenetetrahydrofolate dehydrogenase/methenyltetrahydrofolate cyclohydrolase FolD [Legionella oakridgensis]AHE67506.1 5,10-methylene-tetrahydrofolate dehydrogenase/methenyl tetrahydrofolate cyclohydrolase [Legionella oakridgensis ATCC 33761 = DSM 21215]ETO92892.1 methenyltetrahydrofolate cyclohydrolase/5,10-methylenetetrahydrofolate dehydrogenase (NADP+) [Legionella oakridgensis RV-2-2007]KTD37134.1 methenyltetrahydrofolate cyclohydrolase/5,10-methylenetetrahydrofolate dehydro